MRIGIIDYGMGNLFSVEQALKRLGVDVTVTADREQLDAMDALILPGVGAFPDAMKRLHDAGLTSFIESTKKPLLGICLGMQLLFEESDEVAYTKGLGIFSGRITKFQNIPRIPHMGWNDLQFAQMPNWLTSLQEERFVYFVHSFYASELKREELVAFADYYDVQVPGIVAKNNFTGMQFHPEKSGQFGLFLLQQWLEGVKQC
ncbi:imidazole glycerol phosphate synthase subunit HisH [Metasolibacillus meyeri]|uniref:Imidazole glycerol phosphate synthase subunit HisH n=1 Tax=Metasolibacillus meyeri TaxID=1071052 RepID=A0AAW9NYR5_9BACL|nr:imidazole glycerol phosphate synthase subunit HisH [Metasolibacillus meyeri]MEC1180663.1 imidazole glycerol phosphate synthase subunit HisH [Metasolibacillus meyeri]